MPGCKGEGEGEVPKAIACFDGVFEDCLGERVVEVVEGEVEEAKDFGAFGFVLADYVCGGVGGVDGVGDVREVGAC